MFSFILNENASEQENIASVFIAPLHGTYIGQLLDNGN